MGKDDAKFENTDNLENKDNFGTFNDYELQYDDEIVDEEANKKFKSSKMPEFKPKEENPVSNDPYDILNDQISTNYDENPINYDNQPVIEYDVEKPKIEKEKKKTGLFKDFDNKFVKYGIWGFGALIALVLLIAIFSSFGSGGSKKKNNIEENLDLTAGEKYSFANNVGEYEWTSSDNDVATVNSTGEIEALSDGNTVITITSGNTVYIYQVHVKKLNEVVAVTNIKLDSNTLELETGDEHVMNVSIYPNNATNVGLSWFSSNENIATVDSNGKIMAVGIGSCTITVKTSNGYSDTCLLKVEKGTGNGNNIYGEISEIVIDVSNIVLKSGIEYTLNYEIVPADARGFIEWESGDSSVATVEDGVIKTLKQGTTTIVARNGAVQQTVYVTVVNAGSDSPDVISDGKTVPVDSVTLNQSSISLDIGGKYTLVASVSPENATSKVVSWTSSNSDIAKVDTSGNVIGISAGNAIISATTENGKVANCSVTVKQGTSIGGDYKISLNLNVLNLKIGETGVLAETITPNNYVSGVTWSSSNSSVATVSNGSVKAVGNGTAVITASISNGAKATCTVNVTANIVNPLIVKINAERVELKTNGSTQLSATIMPPNATNKSIKWSSSNPSVATVDSNGKVTAKSNGVAIITATASNGVKSQVTVTVNGGASIKFSRTSISVGVGRSVAIVTIVTNASKNDIKWNSSDTSVATVDKNGIVTGKKAGKATITASVSGSTATCTVTVGASHKSSVASLVRNFSSTLVSSGTDSSRLFDDIIETNGREYKIYKQRLLRNNPFGLDGDIADDGSAAVALSIILSGYKDVNPIAVANYMQDSSYDNIAFTAEYYGMSVNKIIYYDNSENDFAKYSSVLYEINNHLSQGYPVLAFINSGTDSSCDAYKYSGGNSFVAILGIDEDNDLIIGNPGLKDGSGTLEELMTCYMNGPSKGFILLTPNN